MKRIIKQGIPRFLKIHSLTNMEEGSTVQVCVFTDKTIRILSYSKKKYVRKSSTWIKVQQITRGETRKKI